MGLGDSTRAFKSILSIIINGITNWGYSRYLEGNDLGSRVLQPNNLRIDTIKQFATNGDTYGNFNIWREIINVKTSFKRRVTYHSMFLLLKPYLSKVSIG